MALSPPVLGSRGSFLCCCGSGNAVAQAGASLAPHPSEGQTGASLKLLRAPGEVRDAGPVFLPVFPILKFLQHVVLAGAPGYPNFEIHLF